MERREVFDVTKEPLRDLDRYGTHDFGRHCLLARRLLESGVTFVKVTHSNYDTHNENFDFHLEQVGEFDQSFSALLDDLAQRGRLEHTLVVVMSEFGRTPRINHLYGRDHWSAAWSVALAGAGIKPGMVLGKTNANGTAVVDGQVHCRASVPHLSSGRRARPVRHVRGQRPRDPGRRPDRLGHQGTAGMTAEPEKTHVVKEYAHKSPLIACRFDPTADTSSPVPRTIRSGAGTWRRARPPRWRATRAGSSLSRLTPTARRSSPAAAMASSSGGPRRPRSPSRCAGSLRIGAGSAPWPSALTARSSPRAATTG